MDACTVTALGAITAFTVPNPNGHLATPSVFSGPAVLRVAPLDSITQPTLASYFSLPAFSAIDESNPNTA
jgi:hypothetical protein